MIELVFLLEELSARTMLEGLIPLLQLNDNHPRYIVFEGKQDLEKNIIRRIRGYRNQDARFIVIRDLDSSPECKLLKQRLQDKCAEAGRPDTIVRIFCKELETIYIADLKAVENGLNLQGLAGRQGERKFRTPDALGSPSDELKVLTRSLYQKVGGSRAIAPYLDINNERSPSFRALVGALRKACN